MSRPSAETQRLPDVADCCGSPEIYGVSQDPSFAARNSASMTRMFKTASSSGNSNAASPRTARENASPYAECTDRRAGIPRSGSRRLAGPSQYRSRFLSADREARVNGLGISDASGFTDDGDPLMRRQLGCGGERQMPAAGEFKQRADEPVGVKIRVAIHRRGHARRLGAKNGARGHDRVATDVVKRAAAGRAVAHIGRIEQTIGEQGLDCAGRADRASRNEFLGTPPLWMKAHHEGFGDEQPRSLCARRSVDALPCRRARQASRTGHACPPRAPGRTRGRATRSAADCRPPRSRDPPEALHRSRRRVGCRTGRRPRAHWRNRARRSRRSPRLRRAASPG